MSVDAISPIAPACVRALLLPVGKIKRSEFSSCVNRLRSAHRVRLGDISFDPQTSKKTFSPLAFPNGVIIYNITTSVPAHSQTGLFPFETFRESLLVLGVADGNEYDNFSDATQQSNGAAVVLENFQRDLQSLRDSYPRAVSTNLLLFNAVQDEAFKSAHKDVYFVPPVRHSRTTTIKTLMCDISASFLQELSSLAQAMQDSSSIDSPATALLGRSAVATHVADIPETHSHRNSLGSNTSRPETPNLNEAGGSRADSGPHSRSSPARVSRQDLSRSESPSASAVNLSRHSSHVNGHSESVTEGPADRTNRMERPLSRFGDSRSSSKERKSISAAGMNAAAERAKSKLKARQGLIAGALFLHAGRWPDALRELVDGTNRAKAFGDHLWHAKGLDNIFTTMILLAWAGLEFQIPQVCFAVPDKAPSSRSTSASGGFSTSDIRNSSDASNTRTLHALSSQIVDLSYMIVNIYGRASTQPGEAPPQLSLSQCCIRLGSFLSRMHRAGGRLSNEVLQDIVNNDTAVSDPLASSLEPANLRHLRTEIASLVFRGYPSKTAVAVISVQDTVTILSGMVSVLGSAGLERKRALVIKDLLSTMVPALIQARKVGAAEVGIHPAAGMALLQHIGEELSSSDMLVRHGSNNKASFRALLVLICRTFGIDGTPSTTAGEFNATGSDGTTSDEPEKEDTSIVKKSFGGRNMKIDILRLCVHFSDALCHLKDVLIFCAALLRNACLDPAPSQWIPGNIICLPKEEQARIFNRIYRGSRKSDHGASESFEVDYWDDCLIRNVEAPEPTDDYVLVKHTKPEFTLKTETPMTPASPLNTKSGPFLHNPYARAYGNIEEQPTFIAGEPSTLKVTIQNLYDFELAIEKLAIVADGVPFSQEVQSLLVGPQRFEKVSVPVTPETAGELQITGCVAQIQGCKERPFQLVLRSMPDKMDEKVKRTGLPSAFPFVTRPSSHIPDKDNDEDEAERKIVVAPTTRKFRVLNQQPILQILSTSLSQSTITLLDGEARPVYISVRNPSRTVGVDFIHLSFVDSLRPSVQVNSRNRLSAAELYEIELLEATRQTFRWRRTDDPSSSVIPPNSSASFEVVVFGRPGLSECVIQLDYASLGRPLREIKDTFYTRRISLPLGVTVNASTQLQRFDALPVRQSKSLKAQLGFANTLHTEQHAPSLGNEASSFILLLDIRNVWPQPLIASFTVGESEHKKHESGTDVQSTANVQLTIQPGHIKRIALLVPRLWVEDPRAPIPKFNRDSKVQFIVNNEAANGIGTTEAFWYREELLKKISGSWEEAESGRRGIIDLRTIRLSPRMLDIMRKDEVEIAIELSDEDQNGIATETDESGAFAVGATQFLTMKATVRNTTLNPLRGQIRFRPRSSHSTDLFDVDLTRSIAWTGLLRQPLRTIDPGETVERYIGLSMLSAGHYEIGVSAESLTTAEESRRSSSSASKEARVLGTAFCKLIVSNAMNDQNDD